jgi:hypothetical protein
MCGCRDILCFQSSLEQLWQTTLDETHASDVDLTLWIISLVRIALSLKSPLVSSFDVRNTLGQCLIIYNQPSRQSQSRTLRH